MTDSAHQQAEQATQQLTEDQAAHSLPEAVPTVPKKRRKWRCVAWALCLLLLVITLPIAFLATGKGQQLALQWLASSLDQLSIGRVEGSLQEGLHLSDTHFKMDGVDVAVDNADLHIGFGCLMDKKVCLENLAVKGATIAIDTSKLPPSQPKNDEPLGEINLPLPISLKNLSLENLSVNVDGTAVELHHFQSGVMGENNHIQLSPTALDGLTITLSASQAEGSASKNAVAKNAKNESQQLQQKAKKAQPIDWKEIKQQLSQPLLTKLDPIKLPLNLAIPEFSAKNIQLSQALAQPSVASEKAQRPQVQSLLHISSLALSAKSDETSVALKTLNIQTDKGSLVGNGALTLAENYPLNWQLHAKTPLLKEFNLPASEADLTLSGELFGKTALKLKTSGAISANIDGSVELAKPKTPLTLKVQSEAIHYPVIVEKGSDPLNLKNIDVALSGDLLNYQLKGGVAVSGMGIPAGSVSLDGKGQLTEFTLENATLKALEGRADLSGKVDWANGVAWDAQAHLNGINTKSLTPEWAAVLAGNLHSTGYAGRGDKGDEWAVNVSEMDLSGNLLNKKLQLKGALTADKNTLLNVPNAQLIYGENTIGLKGVLGEKSDFALNINAPNLQGLVPNLQASVKGNVNLQGKISEPVLDLDLVANNVRYEETKLQHLTAKGQITTDKVIKGDLDIALKQFSHGEIKIDNAELKASGSEANHSLKLTSKGTPVGANLQLSGKFDRLQQVWQGQLSNIAIQSPMGEWKNDKALQVSYHNKQIKADISAHCWRNPKINICFPTAFSAGKEGKIPFVIHQFDLATVQEFLDKNSQLSGIVSAKGDVAWFAQKSPVANVELTSNSIKFVQKIDYRNFPIVLNPVKIKAQFADNNLTLNTDVRLENNGRLVSDLTMKDVTQRRALSGNIQLDRFTLAVISPLLSGGESIDGNINARLTVGGTAQSPLLFGNLNLTGLKARSNAMPFDVTGGNLSATFNGASSTLKGNVQTKESNLTLEGDANWQKLEAWHTRISAKANRFRVNIPSMAKVDVSPNISVKATPKELVLSGNIDVPWARILVEELPESAVSVSGDEVIMDGSVKQKSTLPLPKNLPQEGKGMAIKADITVNIGQDPKEAVKVDAYGFKSDLKGTLKVRQGRKGLGLYGQVNVVNGTFSSFGQDLIVRKGLISFTGLPSQPTLDVEAIRNPEAMEDQNVVAGVKVTGIADSLDVKVFSNPSMSQDQALSYILTGRSLESSGDAGSSNSIAAALIGLSLSKSSKLVGGVGSAFGITDLNVSTAGIGDNTKVVVSGSLTPRFKVKYGIGIFAPLTELTLRYRLAPSLYLQWISNINQAVDLLYRFEFD